MSTISAAARPGGASPVASTRHTVILIAILLGLALAGGIFQAASGPPGGVARQTPSPAPPLVPMYLSLLAGEWALVFYVWKGGLRRSGTPFRELVGGAWGSAGNFLRDLALGAALWGGWALVPLAWDKFFGGGDAASIEGYLPEGAAEIFVWILLSLSAGFCEELVYRGYLMRQLHAWTGRPWAALVLQAALFGISHGYQGVMACAKIALFGLIFEAVALWRRSLRPGMIAHALTDIVGGIFRI